MCAISNSDDAVHEELFALKGPHSSWIKRWFDEILPVVRYAEQAQMHKSAELRVPKAGLSACDVELRTDGKVTLFEVTIAELALHPDWQNKRSHGQPGAQAAALRRKLNRDGFAESYNPIDGHTLEPLHEARGETPESRLNACVNGLQFALDGKAKGDGYGKGSTLLVYARGIPFFLRCGREWNLQDVLRHLQIPDGLESFERILLVGDEDGWLADLSSQPSAAAMRSSRAPE